MVVTVNHVAKTKASAKKKASEMGLLYKPYYKVVRVKITKLNALDKKRDSNLKGYTYHVRATLKERA